VKTFECADNLQKTCWSGSGALLNVDIICYGLGCISNCPIAREQAALLVELKGQQSSDSSCYCYDPNFKQPDCDTLKEFGCEPIDRNEVGVQNNLPPELIPLCLFTL
jgi:hypothetical protein